jgi:hypothetical protein
MLQRMDYDDHNDGMYASNTSTNTVRAAKQLAIANVGRTNAIGLIQRPGQIAHTSDPSDAVPKNEAI